MKWLFCILFGLLFISCSSNENTTPVSPPNSMYFPPLASDTWETVPPETLGWDTEALAELRTFLQEQNTRAFLILKDGKIVEESYWGTTLQGNAPFDQNSYWYWASAGKTLTAFLVGLAQEEGALSINTPTSQYLGEGWTNLNTEAEAEITVWHQLTMTTGLDYTVDNLDCPLPACLQFKAQPGTQWYYHNAPYTLLKDVVSAATNSTYESFTDTRLEQKIGMNGFWLQTDFNNVYYSTARDAARFGLLILNEGAWNGSYIMQDAAYFQAMVTPSQTLNPSYGYLWWLNGQPSTIFPGFSAALPTSVAPDAPADLFAAMGKNGQIVEVIPSQNMVVVRMGNAPDDSLVPIAFHNQMWEILTKVIP